MRNSIIGSICAAALGLSLGAQADMTAAKQAPADPAQAKVVKSMHHGNRMEMKMGKLAQSKGSTDEVRSYGRMLYDDHKQADADLTAVAGKLGITLASADDGSARDMKVPGNNQDAAANGMASPKVGTGTSDRDSKTAGHDQDATQRRSDTPMPMAGTTPPDAKRDAKVMGGDQDAAGKTHATDSDHMAMMNKDPEMMEHKAMMDELKSLDGRAFDKQFMTMMVKDHQKDISEIKTARASMKDGDELAVLIDKTLPTLNKHLERAQKLVNKMGPQARRPY